MWHSEKINRDLQKKAWLKFSSEKNVHYRSSKGSYFLSASKFIQDMSSGNKVISMKNILHLYFTTWNPSKMLLSWVVFLFRNCAGPWYFYLLPLHLHQVTLLSGPGHLCFQHQQAEGEQTSPTRNSCAKYALSKIWMSRCFTPVDWCGYHSVPLKGEAQIKSWLKLFVYSSIWPEGIEYLFWHTFIPI